MNTELLEKLYYITADEAFENDVNNQQSLIVKKKISKLIGMNTEASVCISIHKGNFPFPLHSHDYIEMMYVCSGSISHSIGGNNVKLEKGDILLLGKNTKHSIYETGKGDIGINFLMSVDFFENMMMNLNNSSHKPEKAFEDIMNSEGDVFAIFHTWDNLPIGNIMENLVYLLVSEKEIDGFVLERSMELLFAYMNDVPHSFSDGENMNMRNEKLKNRLMEYIESSYQSATLEGAAKILKFSPSYLCRWIKAQMGTNFKKILADRRFYVACELLFTTDYSVDTVIEHVGYENRSYFYREFKERYGKTPRQYRKG